MAPVDFINDPTPTAEVDRVEALYLPLVEAVRDLVDATIRSTITDPDQIEASRADIEAVVARLTKEQLPGPAGVRYNDEWRSWSWGNAAVGQRNAIAPPMTVVHDSDGSTHAALDLGAAYEGPPGLVHGGVVALFLDHLMGETASAFKRLTMTGTLTMRYRNGTPLGPIQIEGRIDREEGRKVFVVATVSSASGVTVEAEGIFIVPSWAV